ncbi:amidohydrolase [Serinicoccus sp. CUA-874]|uniref:amidohydrolase n=1 Tax=Serinicoccus sp. CUA-874 TaxID=1517939 RepID=UPI00095B8D79|nr:amidohydrolase [Serinicoccus sp. CUA-874]OLT16221.1 amidohydrolase [Serinicoccus sp. CUA-874]
MPEPTTILDDHPDLRASLHDLYRHLHVHPELSMQEEATATLVEERMGELGYEVFRCGGTGVVATLRNGDGPVVAFRADTDALPVEEDTGLDYASTARGTLPDGSAVPVMHACGHDMHVTAAVGAATLLAQDRDGWSGTVVFLFQPGEETAQGAAAMLADGLWDRADRPEVVYGQHVWPGVTGTVDLTPGPAMTYSDSWKVVVKGRGGHGSQPESTIDPVVLAAHMIVRIQSLTSREVPAQKAAVITIATIHAGLKENIIPATAEFTINMRNLDADVRDHLLGALRRVIMAEAMASEAPEPEITEICTFPLLHNDEDEAGRVLEVLRGTLGEGHVSEIPAVMGSEDFGALPDAIDVPGVYWFFGGLTREAVEGEEPTVTNHSPFFAPELEPTLSTGVSAAHAVLTARLGARA